MKRFGIGLLYDIGGYLITAVVAYFLIGQFSSNVHDRSVEAAMSSIFVIGPIGAVVACVVGLIRTSGTRGPRGTRDAGTRGRAGVQPSPVGGTLPAA